jgi:hypothetical protein
MITAGEVFRPIALALMEWREPPSWEWRIVRAPVKRQENGQ